MMLRFVVWSVLILLTVCIPSLQAQEVEVIPLDGKVIRISYWHESNGLPTWHITDMVQDDRGLVWMGTELGLVSLDGKNFKIHPVSGQPALVQNIQRIVVDTKQNLWLFCATAASNLTILIYDPFSEKTISFEEYTGASVKFSNQVTRTLHKADSLIWILDPHQGIAGYFGPDHHWHEVLHTAPLDKKMQLFLPSSNGQFWHLNVPENSVDLIHTDGSILAHYTIPARFQYLRCRIGEDGYPYLVCLEKVQKQIHPILLRCDASQGLVPVSTMEMFTLTWRHVSNNGFMLPPVWRNNSTGINLVLEASKNLGVYDQNRLLYRGLESHFEKNGIQKMESRIFSLTDGSFWMIGTGALIRIEVSAHFFTSYFEDLPSPPSTRGMGTYGGNLFVNSYSGLYKIHLQTRKSSLYHNQLGRGLSIVGRTLWSNLNPYSASSLDLSTKTIRSYPLDQIEWVGETADVHVALSGAVYVGAPKAVFYKKPGETSFQQLPNLNGSTFHHNIAGLWIGGTGGLWLLNSANQPIKNFLEEIANKGQMPSAINHIHEDASGIFWMATNEGLWRWKPFTREAKTYNQESHDLPANRLHAVYEDCFERLWMPSQNGLLCYDKKQGKFWTFTSKDGLPGSEFNSLSHHRDASGTLYFGGVSGVVSFHPDSLPELPEQIFDIKLLSLQLQSKNHEAPFINLTHAAVFGQDRLFIPSGTRVVHIRYCVPAFLREPIQYRWRIPEMDSSWHELSEPNFSVYGLPYGNYTLELGARLPGNGLASTSSLKLPLRVDRPFYLKLGFLVISVLSLAGMVFFVVRWRNRRLRQLSLLLAIEVAEKTAELKKERDVVFHQKEALLRVNEERTQFFQDLSHEFRNPLTLILGPVNDLLKLEDLPQNYRPRLERVRRNTLKILYLIEEVLEVSRLETGMVPVEKSPILLAAFFQRICQDFEGLAFQKGVSLQLTHHLPQNFTVLTDGRKLDKILTNLIQNALKFTPTGGKVHVKAAWTPAGLLNVWVSDTGVGIAPEHLDKIFERFYQIPSGTPLSGKGGFGIGLSLCRHYATLLGGNITVSSKPGVGTDMHLSILCS